jgi:hypothetical protein
MMVALQYGEMAQEWLDPLLIPAAIVGIDIRSWLWQWSDTANHLQPSTRLHAWLVDNVLPIPDDYGVGTHYRTEWYHLPRLIRLSVTLLPFVMITNAGLWIAAVARADPPLGWRSPWSILTGVSWILPFIIYIYTATTIWSTAIDDALSPSSSTSVIDSRTHVPLAVLSVASLSEIIARVLDLPGVAARWRWPLLFILATNPDALLV